MGKERKACISWLKGKKMRNRFAKKTCNTIMKECPDVVTAEGSFGLR